MAYNYLKYNTEDFSPKPEESPSKPMPQPQYEEEEEEPRAPRNFLNDPPPDEVVNNSLDKIKKVTNQNNLTSFLKNLNSGMNVPLSKSSPEANPLNGLRDLIYGFGKSGANITKLINKNAPDMPDIRSKYSSPLSVAIGQYLPFGISGGASLLGSTGGAAAYGATQYEPGQKNLIDSKLGIQTNRYTNTAEDAIINALTHGAAKLLGFNKVSPIENASSQEVSNISEPGLDFKPKIEYKLGDNSDFHNTQFKAPEFLQSPNIESKSEDLAKAIHSSITGGKDFEESGMSLAKHINNAYNEEVATHKRWYDEIFNQPTNKISYLTEEPFKVKEIPISDKKYSDLFKNDYKDFKFEEKGLKLAHQRYLEDPSIGTAHALQSEYGSEIGYLKNQKFKGLLDAAGKNKLNDYVELQNALKDSIDSKLEDLNPGLAEKYKEVTRSWRNNVVPFQSDADLKSISQGKTRNPTISQVTSIFKNPEDSINTVISKLPQEAKNHIVHLGMGKDVNQFTPKDLIAARSSLSKKGLASYIDPTHEEAFQSLKNSVEQEKNQKLQLEQNQKISEMLRKAAEDAERNRLAQLPKRQSSWEKAKSESDRLANEIATKHKKQFDEEQKELASQQKALADALKAKKAKHAKALKYALSGSVGLAGLELMGLSLPQLISKYVNRGRE